MPICKKIILSGNKDSYPSALNLTTLLGNINNPITEYMHNTKLIIIQLEAMFSLLKIAKGIRAQNIAPKAEYVSS